LTADERLTAIENRLTRVEVNLESVQADFKEHQKGSKEWRKELREDLDKKFDYLTNIEKNAAEKMEELIKESYRFFSTCPSVRKDVVCSNAQQVTAKGVKGIWMFLGLVITLMGTFIAILFTHLNK